MEEVDSTQKRDTLTSQWSTVIRPAMCTACNLRSFNCILSCALTATQSLAVPFASMAAKGAFCSCEDGCQDKSLPLLHQICAPHPRRVSLWRMKAGPRGSAKGMHCVRLFLTSPVLLPVLLPSRLPSSHLISSPWHPSTLPAWTVGFCCCPSRWVGGWAREGDGDAAGWLAGWLDG